MNSEQQERIVQHRAEMPRRYREAYDRAMTGKSRKSAMHAFCAECCGWEIKEVHLCTSPECPLFPYRPRSRLAQGAPEGVPNEPGSMNSAQKGAEGIREGI
ncbi:MAG TPA: hypothetical protein VJJ98_13350 [Sedimentisphaerales bacterium]|nr:hypothetical protein [Sedimentisphaerales bacterium]